MEAASATADSGEKPLVSVIVPCHNAAPWLERCLASVAAQTWRPLQLSFFDDASTDGSGLIVSQAKLELEAAGVAVRVGGGPSDLGACGCGLAKNRAVAQSSGEFLCFLDADDEMAPERVAMQLAEARGQGPRVAEQLLVGCGVERDPPGAQPRFTAWANEARTEQELLHQRFRECPLLMVTWFMHRGAFCRVGGFSEAGRGTPEDLMFFYEHVRGGGRLARVPAKLVTYRSHQGQTSTASVPEGAIWDVRVAQVEAQLLGGLAHFSIWSAGRDGKRFYRSLRPESRRKVRAFFDVDGKKISSGGFFDKDERRHVPVLHFSALRDAAKRVASGHLPVILLVKTGLFPGFEDNLASLQLEEGVDYWHFVL